MGELKKLPLATVFRMALAEPPPVRPFPCFSAGCGFQGRDPDEVKTHAAHHHLPKTQTAAEIYQVELVYLQDLKRDLKARMEAKAAEYRRDAEMVQAYQPGFEPSGKLSTLLADYGFRERAPQPAPGRENWQTRTPNAGPITTGRWR